MVSDIIWTGGGGVYPLGTYGQCHLMHLIIGNKNIYGLGVGSEHFLEYLAFYEMKGFVVAPWGTPGQCHWMGLIIRNNNIYGLGVGY